MSFFKCSGINKNYGAVVALLDASLSVEKGEIRAILGGNGSGKSTLAKIVGGVVAYNSGEIFLNDVPYSPKSPAQAQRSGVVITSQELSLLTNLTVKENLLISNIPKKGGIFIDRKLMHDEALNVLRRLGLEHIIDALVSSLPANQQYMVEFAKALLLKPQLLIVDEITSALYREDVNAFRKIIFELSSQGCTILFISHRMSEIFSICSSVTVLRNGRVVGTNKVADVNENQLLYMLTGVEHHSSTGSSSKKTKDSTATRLKVTELNIPKFNQRINLEVRAGEIIGIAGLQGQGQSEFLRTLFGMSEPVQVDLDENPVLINSPRKAVKLGFAFLSGNRESEGTFVNRAILENLNSVCEGALKRKSDNPNKVLKDIGCVYERVSQPIQTLSGGNQQKVVLGRWLQTKPQILLADDPTKGIDVQARRDVHEMLRELSEKGLSIIYVSSDDEELVDLAKLFPLARIIIMYNGKFVQTLEGDEVSVHNIISASLPMGGSYEKNLQ